MKEFLNTNKYSTSRFDSLKMSMFLDMGRTRKGHPSNAIRMPSLCLMNSGDVNKNSKGSIDF